MSSNSLKSVDTRNSLKILIVHLSVMCDDSSFTVKNIKGNGSVCMMLDAKIIFSKPKLSINNVQSSQRDTDH